MNGGLDELVAERVHDEVAVHCSPEDNPRLQREITVSLGVAPLTVEMQKLEELVDAADMEMYRAKRAGKNRVSVAGQP